MSEGGKLDYEKLMRRAMLKAMRELMAEVLGLVAEEGRPGAYHFRIRFASDHPGVDMADWLRQRFPETMEIVLQWEYWDLAVLGDRFKVTLSFNDRPETLVIPFEAVEIFLDMEAEVGLRFDDQNGEAIEFRPDSAGVGARQDGSESRRNRHAVGPTAPTDAPAGGDADPTAPDEDTADVVSIDWFRKK